MSDLISRSALIKQLTGWRLQECPVGICDEETERYKTICECIKAVEEQPTAFDMGSFVAKLEQLKIEAMRKNYKRDISLDIAIDIVKGDI